MRNKEHIAGIVFSNLRTAFDFSSWHDDTTAERNMIPQEILRVSDATCFVVVNKAHTLEN